MNKEKKQLYVLCESGVMIAMATVLSFIEIQIGVFGGSINPAMLPILILAWRHGMLWGIGAGGVFGFIKCIIGSGLGWGLPSIMLDYVLAYALVGVMGLFKRKMWALEIGTVMASAARFLSHFASGFLLWRITEPTEIEGIGTFVNPYVYSLVYNAVYVVPSMLLCVVLIAVLRSALKSINRIY